VTPGEALPTGDTNSLSLLGLDAEFFDLTVKKIGNHQDSLVSCVHVNRHVDLSSTCSVGGGLAEPADGMDPLRLALFTHTVSRTPNV
jgi:hypothetical protein